MAGLDDLSVGNFTSVMYSTDGNSWNDVENVSTVTTPTTEKNVVEVQLYNEAAPRKLNGSKTIGAMEMETAFNPSEASYAALNDSYKNDTKLHFKVIYWADLAHTKGHEQTFRGTVSTASVSSEFDAARMVSYSVSVDGDISDLTATAPKAKAK